MNPLRPLLHDNRGASAVEFALVAPLMILFLLGIIDVGRFIWNVNEAEKATQIGTRWAVATDMIPSGLYSYSFATRATNPVPQGAIVPEAQFGGLTCNQASGCTCKAEGACDAIWTSTNIDAFGVLVGRMNEIYGGIGAGNVQVDYDWSGLGYSGDPNGSDVDPLVTVTTSDLNFRPIFLGGIFDVGLPDLSYTLTMEDGQGNFAN